MSYQRGDPVPTAGCPAHCDVCAIGNTRDEYTLNPRPILAFRLMYDARVGTKVSRRSCGVIHLCERCWRGGPGRRTKGGRPRTLVAGARA